MPSASRRIYTEGWDSQTSQAEAHKRNNVIILSDSYVNKCPGHGEPPESNHGRSEKGESATNRSPDFSDEAHSPANPFVGYLNPGVCNVRLTRHPYPLPDDSIRIGGTHVFG